MATYQVTHKQLLDGYAVLQTLTPSEFEVGQSLTVAGITGFNGTYTIYALPQFAFIGIDSEGDLLFNYEIPIPNQVLFALAGDRCEPNRRKRNDHLLAYLHMDRCERHRDLALSHPGNGWRSCILDELRGGR
jgi:hypothetical protein